MAAAILHAMLGVLLVICAIFAFMSSSGTLSALLIQMTNNQIHTSSLYCGSLTRTCTASICIVDLQKHTEVQLDQDAPLWSFSLWHDKKTGKSLLVYIKQLSGTEGNHLLVYKAAAWRQMACT